MGLSGDEELRRWGIQEMGTSRDGDCSSYLKIKKTKVAQNCLNEKFWYRFRVDP